MPDPAPREAVETNPMPMFVLKAKDKLATAAIRAYYDSCKRAGLDHQAEQVQLAHAEFRRWQQDHRDEMKFPDHDHRRAGTVGSGSEVVPVSDREADREELIERLTRRLMNFGGFQRTEQGEFWISRDSVLRLIQEELGPSDPLYRELNREDMES